MARSDMDGRLEQCVMAYGSTSLFILPIRYRHFIPLLAEIEKEYRPDKVMIIHEINKFIRKNIDAIQQYDEDICRRLGETKEEVVDGLTKKLDDFAEGLWKSGQTLDFWNIDLSSPWPWDEEERIQDRQAQSMYTHLYHKMYGYY